MSMEYIQPILSSMVTTAGEQSAVLHLSNPIYLAQNFVSVVSLKGFLKLSTFPNNSMSSNIATLEGPCTHQLTSQRPSNHAGTSSPPSRLKRFSRGVIWMWRASFTNSSCPPVRWSPPSGLGGGSPTHALLQLTPYFRPLRESVKMLVTDNLLPLLTHLP